MKKFITILFLVGLLLPVLSHAQTLSGVAADERQQALISLLRQLIDKLQAQLALLQSRTAPTAPPNFSTSPPAGGLPIPPLPPIPTPSGQPPVLISPNGGEAWTIGSPRFIRWQTDYTNAAVNLSLVPVTADAIPFHLIAPAAPNTGVYIWPAGRLASNVNAPSGNYRLRVCYFYPINLCDESEGVLTLTNPPAVSDLSVLSPTVGEIWTRGEPREIRWSSPPAGGGGSSITLTLLNSANVPYLISGQTPNSGSFAWRVGDTVLGVLPPDGDYRLQICYTASTVCSAVSFKLVSTVGQTPSLVITSPNGGERLTRGENLTITWHAVGLDTVSLFLVRANYPNVPVRTIALSLPAMNSAASGSYTWAMPTALLAGSDYQVRITSVQLPAGDLSDDVFSIVAP